ncbi:peptidase S16 lon domain protein [Chlorobaculum parvum NCIB 8327]|uniref:endopeptidase La n=1 Tax=Chlorobaculum parvum (strain DSM 263 / NCIMB 8327) TaxID=517417 RepID=B3QKW2_CHLP8|nr:AAA family ATPase [Chlorobaculum parvum]ACF10750.1 peptidase S16 lon domain protein [Chlorobaculum parvum NCIB 8327]
MPVPEKLRPEQLFNRCDPDAFEFNTTADLDGTAEIAGQERALEAIRLGMGIRRDGFNLFALGPAGTGKQSTVLQFLNNLAPGEARPDDWCYVYNFDKPRNPKALRLPPGRACKLSDDMAHLVETLFSVMPSAFSSEEYQTREKEIEESIHEQQASAIEALEQDAKEHSISLIRTPGGFAFAPLKKGEVIKPDDYMRLKEAERAKIEEQIDRLRDVLQSIMAQFPKWQRETAEKIKELNREVSAFALKPLMDEIRAKYKDLDEVLKYLDDVQNDIIENFIQFLEKESSEQGAMTMLASLRTAGQRQTMIRYRVNVMIDNSELNGAPVILEDKPASQNLIGDIEHSAQMGTLVTDFTLIKPGALHRANGGYLILDARRLLLEPFAWEALKKAIRTRQIRIESLAQLYSLVSTISLEPEPIPLEIKVILLGERSLYYLLSSYDPDFNELFKIAADFENDMPRNDETQLAYARLIGSMAELDKLLPFDRTAVARIIEHGSRMAGDATRLTSNLQNIRDLAHEADHHAAQNGRKEVVAEDVEAMLEAQRYRASRIQERLRDNMMQGTILIDTDSEKTGQINGLSVYSLGDQSFGSPSRITARVRLGKGVVIDIEREVEMGGPIHSKGVMILSGFLGSRYAAEQPLSLSATLVFEQSYGGVEGDSASSAELYALLSAISGIPIRQWLAVTGSVNQHGEVQAIGGVNEKIEGFFDLCNERGLDGRHGVLIPASNVKHLMLRQDIVKAVESGLFSIWPVSHIDEGIELLTGIPAGEMDETGAWPEGTVNAKVYERLKTMAEKQKSFGKKQGDEPDK